MKQQGKFWKGRDLRGLKNGDVRPELGVEGHLKKNEMQAGVMDY